MSQINLPQNPGIGDLKELTASELAVVQQLGGLGDPNADRILFWDDSANSFAYLTAGTGLSIVGTTITATASGSVSGPGSSTDNAIVRWDGTGGATLQNSTVTIGDTGGISSTIASGGNAVALTLTQNDTTNNPNAMTITNAGTGQALLVTQTGNTSASISTGGSVNITNTSNSGPGLVVYTNHGASQAGRLVVVNNNNTAFDQDVMLIQSVASNTTALNIKNAATGKGALKIEQTSTSSDSNASAISIDLQGSGTAAQGIFIDATGGGTTGKLLNLRNNGTEYFTVTSNGQVGIQSASPTGKLDIDGTLTVASGAAAVLDDFALRGSTITISGSTNITTAAGFNYASFKNPTLSAGTALTITNASTVYIKDAPTAGGAGPAAITNAYALWIDAGKTRLDGDLMLNSSNIIDGNGNNLITMGTTASAVNYVKVTNAATGTTGALIAAEGETNVDIRLAGKGTGKIHNTTGSYGDITADSDGATITFNMATSNLHSVTLGGNRTLAVSNVAVGQTFMLRLQQDTSTRTVTWFTTIKWAGGSAPTLTLGASNNNKADLFGFVCTSSNNYDGFVIGQNI